ncbi:MAG TPA: AAA family ATPase [Candidatus Cybelea sp.]|nr:AAA family ATPase [Candidatus Cybelea sp.]
MIGAAVRCRTFVGRGDELAALEHARRELSKSRGCFVLVSGEPGIGKSRLLSRFRQLTPTGRSRNIAVADCLPYAQRPFGAIRSLLGVLVPTVSLDELPPPLRRALIQLVPECFETARIATPTPVVLEKEDLFSALLGFLAAVCAKRATLLFIEDLHWADTSTLDFLRFVAARMDNLRLMLAATYRTEQLLSDRIFAQSIGSLERETTVRRIDLIPLTPAEIESVIIDALEGQAPISHDAIASIAKRSDGNPFYAEELLKTTLERRRSHTANALPLTIRTTILERLGALDAEERDVLSHAAVLGYHFDPAVLADVIERDRTSVLPALRKAVRHDLLIEQPGTRGGLRFRHWLTRETIYDAMLAVDARALHQRILSHLEGRPDSRDRIIELAYHASQCGDAQKALAYGEQAAENALAMRAIGEASEIITKTLPFAADDARRAHLQERLAEAYRLQGKSRAAIDALERAMEIRLVRNEYDDAAGLMHQLVAERVNVGDDDAFASLERFLSVHAERLTPPLRDRLFAFAARYASANNDFTRVRTYLTKVSPLETLEPATRLSFLIAQMNECAYEGNAPAWRAVAENFADLLPHLTPFLRTIANYTIAQTGIHLDVRSEVDRAIEAANRTTEEWGFGSLGLFGAGVEAVHAFQYGELVRARDRLERVLEKPGSGPANGLAAQVGPYLALALGDDQLALRAFHEPLFAAARSNRDISSLLALSARAAWLCSKGRPFEAVGDLRLAVNSLTRTTAECGPLLAAAARYLQIDELSAVRAFAEEHDAAAASAANAHLVEAIIAQRRGSHRQSVEEARSAATSYRHLSWPLYEAEALELAGDIHGARAIYRICGAAGHLARLSPEPSDSLSAREIEVASLVTDGLTNAAIAAALMIGEKTVEKHLGSVYRKLAVRSRAGLAAKFSKRSAG